MDDDNLIPISALQHYLYCPRQCALIHVEQLWAENRQTAEGRLLHERADRPQVEQRHGVRTVTAMPLINLELGISGVADVVEFHQGAEGERAFPVEYKRGRPKAIAPMKCKSAPRPCASKQCSANPRTRGALLRPDATTQTGDLQR